MSLLTELENSWEHFAAKISPLTGLAEIFPASKTNALFCDGHVESPALQFFFEDTSGAALARWKSLQTATDHLPHREKLSP